MFPAGEKIDCSDTPGKSSCDAQNKSTHLVNGGLDLVRPGVDRQVCIKVPGLVLGRQIQVVRPQAALRTLLLGLTIGYSCDLPVHETAAQHAVKPCKCSHDCQET